MDFVEQAVFTSAETDRSAGYQVVATSPGVCDADVRELSAWGPSHGALLDSGPGAASVNFHPLPSGCSCVSRTLPAGWEYSGRRGMRVYTQCLITPPSVLGRFANNPFALLKAAMAGGSLRLYDEVPKRLDPIRLVGRAAPLDANLLARLACDPGPEWMASLVQAVLTADTVAVGGGPPAEQVFAGLINCFPPQCRNELSFTTGLKPSSRRPFRVVALSDDREEQLRVARLYDATVCDLAAGPPTDSVLDDSWARLIYRVLKAGRTSVLANEFADHKYEMGLVDLPALGLQLLEELDASWIESEVAGGPVWDEIPPRPAHRETASRREVSGRGAGEAAPAGTASQPASPRARPHSAHNRFGHASRRAADHGIQAPSVLLVPDDIEKLEKLERLDDLVYDAIAGQTTAMDELRAYWPEIRDELGDDLVGESREQYLRYALSIWEKCVAPDKAHDPHRAVHSLEVLCLLFDEV